MDPETRTLLQVTIEDAVLQMKYSQCLWVIKLLQEENL